MCNTWVKPKHEINVSFIFEYSGTKQRNSKKSIDEMQDQKANNIKLKEAFYYT